MRSSSTAQRAPAALRYLAFAIALTFLPACSALAAVCTAEAVGSIYKGPNRIKDQDFDAGVTQANASVTLDSAYGHFFGSASVLYDPTHSQPDYPFLTLHAKATATASPDSDPEIGPASGYAQATFSSRIVPYNALDAFLAEDPYVYLDIGIDGRLEGRGAQASFEYTVAGKTTGFSLVGDYQGFRIPARIQDFVLTGIDYKLVLTASASATLGATATSDFFKTLKLGPLLIGDANGNPIPGSESLILRDDNGQIYPTAAIPEPTAALTATLLPLAALRRRAKLP